MKDKKYPHFEIPEEIEGIGKLTCFKNADNPYVKDGEAYIKKSQRSRSKVVESVRKVIELSGLENGMTISFHHHFRNGDYIVNMVMDEIAEMGIRDLVLAASSLIDCHKPLIKHIKNGVIKRIETSGLRGELAEAVSDGLMDLPIVFRSHGGRAKVISSGELKIDVAFLGAPTCDAFGNANGYSKYVECSACGSIGYAKLDAQYAEKVVIITDKLVPFPNTPFGIAQTNVDYVVEVDSIGDPKGIVSGATRFTTNPRELLIAQNAADVIEYSGYFKDGFSFQTGTGGSALAVTRYLRQKMIDNNITASFVLGGITGQMVELLEENLVKKILDVQSFDLKAVDSLKVNNLHEQIDSAYYASPSSRGCTVDQLDVVLLSALEIDLDFNVNVLTGSDGIIRGAIGGHSDTSAGASLSIIVAPLIRGRIPTILDKVNTIVTPGETIDVFVTEHGIAVNPRCEELKFRLKEKGLPVFTINELKEKAEKIVGHPEEVSYIDRIVGLVSYRDGSIIDTIKQIKRN